jgi:uncharacterized membrane protein
MNDHSFKKLIKFQILNFVMSCLVYMIFPRDMFGFAVIYVIFSIKLIALLYLNDYPEKKDKFSITFFALACIEIILLFWTGSFSIYTFAFSQF